jgi:hypothetical protein
VARFANQKDLRLEVSSRGALAEALVEAGDLNGADTEARRGLDLAGELIPVRAAACAVMAWVQLAQAKPQEALETACVGMALRAQAAMEERETLLRLAHATAQAETGSPHGALEALRSLVADLALEAERIEDVGIRTAFLDHVPENVRARETLARVAIADG